MQPTDNQLRVSDELAKLVLQRVYIKIAPQLSDEDMSKIEQLNSQDESGSSVRNFLISKFPDLDQMLQEEVNILKNELQAQ